MKKYELTNEHRKYFGLEPIESHWEKVILIGDAYRTESILYFDKDIIKRHIVSSAKIYTEKQYNDSTIGRKLLLPKSGKGKEKKLSASVLEQLKPTGVFLSINCGHLTIGNYNSQTTFYTSHWNNEQHSDKDVPELINDFIKNTPDNHFIEIQKYKNLKRQNIKFKSGDYFCFKLDREHYGFGRILLDINKIRKKKLIDDFHGLGLIMGTPVIVMLYAFKSKTKNIAIEILEESPKLPSDIMMDNLLFYGEYEIIGHRKIPDEAFDFPISYGRSIDQRGVVFLQWGLIYKELSQKTFNKYIYTDELQLGQNPYGYYAIGLSPHYDNIDVIHAIKNNGIFNYENAKYYRAKWDLRNAANKEIKTELLHVFGLDPNKSYIENSKMTGTMLPSEIIKQLE